MTLQADLNKQHTLLLIHPEKGREGGKVKCRRLVASATTNHQLAVGNNQSPPVGRWCRKEQHKPQPSSVGGEVGARRAASAWRSSPPPRQLLIRLPKAFLRQNQCAGGCKVHPTPAPYGRSPVVVLVCWCSCAARSGYTAVGLFLLREKL